jgi:hypothetical protein
MLVKHSPLLLRDCPPRSVTSCPVCRIPDTLGIFFADVITELLILATPPQLEVVAHLCISTLTQERRSYLPVFCDATFFIDSQAASVATGGEY